MSGASGAKAY